MKRKIIFYRNLLAEICETLATICLYLESNSRRAHNPYGEHMRGHFNELELFSKELREMNQKKMTRENKLVYIICTLGIIYGLLGIFSCFI